MSTQLPFDIELLIIQRLPIKSLLRFRSVCKEWNSFISSSKFIAAFQFHHAHSQQQHFIISYKNIDHQLKYVSVFDDFALTVPPLVQGTRVLSSSHGLLCMIDSFDSFTQTKMAVLWNPAIKKSIAVIVPRVVDDQQFDSVVGFGVCPATKDPKLVKVTFISDPLKMESISCIPFQVRIFTLSSGQWTTPPSTTNLPSKSIVFDNSYQTVIGRFIYLAGCDWSVLDDNGEGRSMIMSFDLTTHEFKEVDIPNTLRRRSYHVIVSRVRESLVLFDIEPTFIDGHSRQLFNVWMMDDSKVFTKLFTINPPNATVWWTLGFRESGEPIIEWTYDEMDLTHGLAVYEPDLGYINDLGICGSRFYGSSYTESLLLLDHEDGRIIRC